MNTKSHTHTHTHSLSQTQRARNFIISPAPLAIACNLTLNWKLLKINYNWKLGNSRFDLNIEAVRPTHSLVFELQWNLTWILLNIEFRVTIHVNFVWHLTQRCACHNKSLWNWLWRVTLINIVFIFKLTMGCVDGNLSHFQFFSVSLLNSE